MTFQGRGDGHAGWGGFPHEIDFGRGKGVGLVDEIAEGALQVQSFGGEGPGGFDGAGVLGPQGVDAGPVSGCFLPRMRLTSPTQVSESSSVTARSLLLGFSIAYSTRIQSSGVHWVCCWREVIAGSLMESSRGAALFRLLSGEPMV